MNAESNGLPGFAALQPSAEDVVAAAAKTGREVGLDEAQEILDGLNVDELHGVLIRAVEASDDLDGQTEHMVEGIAAMLADDAPSPRFG
jgi:hypothetical protein